MRAPIHRVPSSWTQSSTAGSPLPTIMDHGATSTDNNNNRSSRPESPVKKQVQQELVVENAITNLATLKDVLTRIERQSRIEGEGRNNNERRASDEQQHRHQPKRQVLPSPPLERNTRGRSIDRIRNRISATMTPGRRQYSYDNSHNNTTTTSTNFTRSFDERQIHDTRRDVSVARNELRHLREGDNIDNNDPPPRPIQNDTLGPIQKTILVDLFQADTEDMIVEVLDSIVSYCSLDTNEQNVEMNRNLIADIGGHFILLGILKKWYDSAPIQENGCIALHYLTVNKRIRDDYNNNQLDTIETIIQIMNNYPNNARIQQYSCGILSSLTWKNENSTVRLLQYDGIHPIIADMKQYGSNTILQQFGTLLLINIIRWDKFRPLLIQAGGRERLTKVIMDYTEQESKKSQPSNTTTSTNGTTMVDFDYKIYKKARKAIRRLL